jgi:glucose/arabinose dehydrogenase
MRAPGHLGKQTLQATLLAAGLCWTPSARAVDLPPLELEPIASLPGQGVAITYADDERLFVTLKQGRVMIVSGGQVLARPFLDVSSRVGSAGQEQGLLSVAFSPHYGQDGFFFVAYTRPSNDLVIARYSVTADPDLADPDSEAILLDIPKPTPIHNGGQLQFGPDGYLYVSVGDGGPADDPDCQGQDDDTLLGKILRLDVDQNVGVPPFHGIPADNPFVGPGPPRDEIWAKGLRNPWRFSFDRATGDLFVGDVGQGAREEVDRQPAGSGGGQNYGWTVMEGDRCHSAAGCGFPVPPCGAPEFTAPIVVYGHDGGRCAVIGGYVYRGAAIPQLRGAYLYGDLCSGELWAAVGGGASWTAQLLGPTAPWLATLGEDRNGEIYLAAGSSLFRLRGTVDAGSLEFGASVFTVQEGAGTAVIRVDRFGGSEGAVEVGYATADGTATAGADYAPTAGILHWNDGDAGTKSFQVPIFEDPETEGEESFTVALSNPTGGAFLGTPQTAQVTIEDDDSPTAPCAADEATLCLLGGRFEVGLAWRTAAHSGAGHAMPLSGETGYFWFFSPENVEVVVKVHDACTDPFDRYWVFAAGLTNVETTLTVLDTATGLVRRYDKPAGVPFPPVQDVNAFASCP